MSYVNKIKILNENQLGFRKNLLTNFSLTDLVNKITKALDNNKFGFGFFLDNNNNNNNNNICS